MKLLALVLTLVKTTTCEDSANVVVSDCPILSNYRKVL